MHETRGSGDPVASYYNFLGPTPVPDYRVGMVLRSIQLRASVCFFQCGGAARPGVPDWFCPAETDDNSTELKEETDLDSVEAQCRGEAKNALRGISPSLNQVPTFPLPLCLKIWMYIYNKLSVR